MAAKWIIVIGRISNIFFSETTGPNLTKLCRNDVLNDPLQKYHFSFRLKKKDGHQDKF